jgi:protein-S-isoprenylcysteine O-methyltransferase Ste14
MSEEGLINKDNNMGTQNRSFVFLLGGMIASGVVYDYGYVIVASWFALMTVWVIGAFTAKRDVSTSPTIVLWLWRIPLLALLIYALRNLHDDAAIFERAFFNFGPALNWVGTFLTVIGVTFAIWARYSLGRNWGSNTKEDPVLVTSGPYAYVRHPLYAGAILGLFGSALTGSMVAVVMFMISIVFCLRRIHKEERVMLSLFPGQYPAYQARTKRLIPFVW